MRARPHSSLGDDNDPRRHVVPHSRSKLVKLTSQHYADEVVDRLSVDKEPKDIEDESEDELNGIGPTPTSQVGRLLAYFLLLFDIILSPLACQAVPPRLSRRKHVSHG